MNDQLTPDALAGAVERVQRLVEQMTEQAGSSDDSETWVGVTTDIRRELRLLLACAASHVPEADRERALVEAARAGMYAEQVQENARRAAWAEACTLLRLPSRTERRDDRRT